MASISQDYINNILIKVFEQNSMTECQHIISTFECKAQNYFGVLVPVRVTGVIGGHKVNIDLVLKLAPTDERYRVSGAVTLMFAREIFLYSVILEKYREYQNILTLNANYLIPKLYYVCKDYCAETLVLQNMCPKGFTPYIRKAFLDYDHLVVSLKQLAIFHAMSFILKEKDSKLYEEAVKICVPLTEKENKRFIEILLDRLRKVIQKFENTEYAAILRNYEENCVKYVEAAAFSVHALCICHGDIWKENILFKYEKDVPVAACLIDYQASRMSSPAYDVLYLITTSTETDLRKNNYNDFLNIYYEMFKDTLHCGGLEAERIYSRKYFDEDLKTVGPACFIVANTALWLSNGLQEEGHVRSKQVWNTPEEKEMAVKNYKCIIQNIITDFISYGYNVL